MKPSYFWLISLKPHLIIEDFSLLNIRESDDAPFSLLGDDSKPVPTEAEDAYNKVGILPFCC